jgi:hypothetical protein
MCSFIEINEYAFYLGLKLLKGFYETCKDLQGLIRLIAYLIKRAIF